MPTFVGGMSLNREIDPSQVVADKAITYRQFAAAGLAQSGNFAIGGDSLPGPIASEVGAGGETAAGERFQTEPPLDAGGVAACCGIAAGGRATGVSFARPATGNNLGELTWAHGSHET